MRIVSAMLGAVTRFPVVARASLSLLTLKMGGGSLGNPSALRIDLSDFLHAGLVARTRQLT